MSTIIFEFSARYLGFGRLTTALFPGVNLGFLRLSWARGSLEKAIMWRVDQVKAALL